MEGVLFGTQPCIHLRVQPKTVEVEDLLVEGLAQ